MSGNTFFLYVITVLVAAIFFVLTYDIFDLRDFSFFHKKPKYTVIPAECFPKKVTLGDLCELCPKTIFKVVDGGGGFAIINPQNIDNEKLNVYKTLSAYNLNTQNQTLEVSDPSLL